MRVMGIPVIYLRFLIPLLYLLFPESVFAGCNADGTHDGAYTAGAGFGRASVPECVSGLPALGFLSQIMCVVVTIITSAMFDIYCSLVAAWRPIFWSLSTLYIIVYFVSLLFGIGNADIKEGISRFLKLAIILVVGTYPDVFYEIFYNGFMGALNAFNYFVADVADTSSSIYYLPDTPEYDANCVPPVNAPLTWEAHELCREIASGSTVFDQVDTLFERVVGGDSATILLTLGVALILSSMGLGLILFLLIILGLIAMIMSFVRLIIAFITAIVAMNFLLMFTPIFFLTKLFKVSEDLFSNWLASLISYTLQPLIILVFLLAIGQASSVSAFVQEMATFAGGAGMITVDPAHNYELDLVFTKFQVQMPGFVTDPPDSEIPLFEYFLMIGAYILAWFLLGSLTGTFLQTVPAFAQKLVRPFSYQSTPTIGGGSRTWQNMSRGGEAQQGGGSGNYTGVGGMSNLGGSGMGFLRGLDYVGKSVASGLDRIADAGTRFGQSERGQKMRRGRLGQAASWAGNTRAGQAAGKAGNLARRAGWKGFGSRYDEDGKKIEREGLGAKFGSLKEDVLFGGLGRKARSAINRRRKERQMQQGDTIIKEIKNPDGSISRVYTDQSGAIQKEELYQNNRLARETVYEKTRMEDGKLVDKVSVTNRESETRSTYTEVIDGIERERTSYDLSKGIVRSTLSDEEGNKERSIVEWADGRTSEKHFNADGTVKAQAMRNSKGDEYVTVYDEDGKSTSFERKATLRDRAAIRNTETGIVKHKDGSMTEVTKDVHGNRAEVEYRPNDDGKSVVVSKTIYSEDGRVTTEELDEGGNVVSRIEGTRQDADWKLAQTSAHLDQEMEDIFGDREDEKVEYTYEEMLAQEASQKKAKEELEEEIERRREQQEFDKAKEEEWIRQTTASFHKDTVPVLNQSRDHMEERIKKVGWKRVKRKVTDPVTGEEKEIETWVQE